MSRWDHILDQKPQELKEYVLDKVAEQLVEDLREFPPRIEEWLDDALRARYARGARRALGRPELDTYRVACEMAREEMLREYELIDRFCRSDEYRRLLPTELEQQTAHFITRYLVDSALAFQEYGQDKFKRRDLVTLMEKVEDGLLRGYRLRLSARARSNGPGPGHFFLRRHSAARSCAVFAAGAVLCACCTSSKKSSAFWQSPWAWNDIPIFSSASGTLSEPLCSFSTFWNSTMASFHFFSA